MITTHENRIAVQDDEAHVFHADETTAHHFAYWPVCWSAIQVGALAALAAIVALGLIGVALGFHLVGVENRVADLNKVGLMTVAFSVFSAVLAFVLGGWVAGKVAGIHRSEPAMLHGAITWLATVPVLIVLATLGAGSYFGGWYGGLAGSPGFAAAPYDAPMALDSSASPEDRDRK